MAYLHSPLRSKNNLHDSNNDENARRIYVADLSTNCTKHQIEKAFEKWPLIEVWHGQASCFAFVILQHRADVQHAISELDGQWIGDARVRVTLARPRNRSITAGRKHCDSNRRCYRCGHRGHLSRDCENQQHDKKRRANTHRSRISEETRRNLAGWCDPSSD